MQYSEVQSGKSFCDVCSSVVKRHLQQHAHVNNKHYLHTTNDTIGDLEVQLRMEESWKEDPIGIHGQAVDLETAQPAVKLPGIRKISELTLFIFHTDGRNMARKASGICQGIEVQMDQAPANLHTSEYQNGEVVEAVAGNCSE